MIITPEEMALIKERPHGRQPRRMMRLPVTYSDEAIKRPCPMREGKSYTLQTDRKGEPCQVYILVIGVREERLGELLESDARREGYKNSLEACNVFLEGRRLGGWGQPVWVISFQVVDEPVSTLDQPVFLSRVGDYTTLAGRQAVPGDPEVCILAGEVGEQARVMALAERSAPHVGAINRATREVESLHESLMSMRARNRAKLIARELSKLRSELPVTEVVASAASVELPATRRAS